MVISDLDMTMPPYRPSSRIDIVELKDQIVRKLGNEKSEKYFSHLKKFLNLRINKCEFDKLCISTIGIENVSLHNQFVRSILKNACVAKLPPTNTTTVEGFPNVTIANGLKKNLQPLLGDTIPLSPHKGRSVNIRDRKFRDRTSPLGPNGKVKSLRYDELISGPPEILQAVTNSCDLKRSQELHNAPELVSIGSKALAEVVSVEDGEEVEQVTGSPCVESRSPVRAPLGIPRSVGIAHKWLRNDLAAAYNHLECDIIQTCHYSCELPDVRSLKIRLQKKLEREGFDVSDDYVNLLSHGLDAFLKRLINPCMELARSRCHHKQAEQVIRDHLHGGNVVAPSEYAQGSAHSVSASFLDFKVAMELNPQLLGENWPAQLENIFFLSSEQ